LDIRYLFDDVPQIGWTVLVNHTSLFIIGYSLFVRWCSL